MIEPAKHYRDQAQSIFTLVDERWGLKLQSERVLAKVLVIDPIERPIGELKPLAFRSSPD